MQMYIDNRTLQITKKDKSTLGMAILLIVLISINKQGRKSDGVPNSETDMENDFCMSEAVNIKEKSKISGANNLNGIRKKLTHQTNLKH